jgi:hypothetical protein
MNNIEEPRLGVDFGRVIQGAALPDGGADTTFLSGGIAEALASPASPDVFEVLPRLVERFDGRVWIISKCGPATEHKTRLWLDHHDFWQRTGIPRDNVRFCRARADKALHCAELQITHMIDDRLDVHQAIRDLVPYCYLFGPQPEPAPDWVVHVQDWPEADEALSRSAVRQG